MAMADGSIHFISDSIDYRTWCSSVRAATGSRTMSLRVMALLLCAGLCVRC